MPPMQYEAAGMHTGQQRRRFSLVETGDKARRIVHHQIHVSAATRKALGNAFRFEPRGALEVKGKGSMETYFLYRQ